MKRLLTLWLTLLGGFWFTRAMASAVVFQRIADRGTESLVMLVAVPFAQALVIGWLTRALRSGEPPSA